MDVIELVLTSVGFTVTIIGVLRAKSAAEQAQKAVADVREDVLRTNMVAEFAAAVAVMEEIKRLHRQEALPALLDRYASLRKSLVSIKSANGDMPEHHKIALQGSIQQFSDMEETVEEALATEQGLLDPPRFNRIVSQQIDKVQEILAEVRAQIGE